MLGERYDLKRANSYIRGCKRFLDRIGIDNKLVQNKKERSLIILPSLKKNTMNKLAYSLDRNYHHLVFEINPHTTLKDDALGFYISEEHKFVISELTLNTLEMKDTTFHHEIRHAMLTYRYLSQAKDSVFNYELVMLKPEKAHQKTGYEDYLSLQELSTYPIEALQLLSIYQHNPKKQTDEMLELIESTILQSNKISRYVIEFTDNFNLTDITDEIYYEKYLGRNYRYLKITNADVYQFTIPYFDQLQTDDVAPLVSRSLSKARDLAYDVWYASEEVLIAFNDYQKNKSPQAFKNLREKIKILTAKSRFYL